jgi:hypothetical protein
MTILTRLRESLVRRAQLAAGQVVVLTLFNVCRS